MRSLDYARDDKKGALGMTEKKIIPSHSAGDYYMIKQAYLYPRWIAALT